MWRISYARGLDSAVAALEAMIEEVQDFWPDDEQSRTSHPNSRVSLELSKKVFVAHGRDEGPKHEVARFITELNLEPVILEEQADKGRTIIAKFEEEAREVKYAVVLLTPDDEGRLGDSGAEYSPRARQNVIFELGYFAGALGRRQVCALVKGEIEKPSDYDGVVYIPYNNSGGWKLSLVRELKAAGLDVDANLAF
ncbi:MAG: nucleotide-binding protein [Caldilineaceae bacterium]|nr:nucleotide-binding protein [Caldilineaceae bacterium]